MSNRYFDNNGNLLRVRYIPFDVAQLEQNLLEYIKDNQLVMLQQIAPRYGFTVLPSRVINMSNSEISPIDNELFAIGSPRQIQNDGVVLSLSENPVEFNQEGDYDQLFEGNLVIGIGRNSSGVVSARKIMSIYATAFAAGLQTLFSEMGVSSISKLLTKTATDNTVSWIAGKVNNVQILDSIEDTNRTLNFLAGINFNITIKPNLN